MADANQRRTRWMLIALLACVSSLPRVFLMGAEKEEEHQIKAKAYLSVDKLPSGGKCEILVKIEVKDGWNIKSNPAEPMEFIPTTVTIKSKRGIKFVKPVYPKGKSITEPDSDEATSVYEGEVWVRGTLEIPADAAGKSDDLEVLIKYQACQAGNCLPPKTVKLQAKLDIAAKGETVNKANEELFETKAETKKSKENSGKRS